MAARTGGRVYLFEFKVVEQAGEGAALAQLRERGYAAKYRGRGEPIHLIGVEFSRKTRTLTAFIDRRRLTAGGGASGGVTPGPAMAGATQA